MHDTAKYLIHADITADGVVERSDVVGAVFGQTEGLLGDELDLRSLQDASKVGRIDVEIRSESGQSFGTITIASGLDRVETAVLAAALETIDRVGPCRSRIEVRDIEDVRSARRREVVERAKRLLDDAFADGLLTSQELVAEVREAIRVEDIAEYEGSPAGPRVADSDAIIVVEGRADVLQLLKYGVKNAVAVEGTNVPDAVADLTNHRTVTAFLDGDRGGDLILRELAQVGDVDYVALAPTDRSVEDLSRREVMTALREKVPYDRVADASSVRDVLAPPDPDDGTGSPPNQPAPTGPHPGSADGEQRSGSSTAGDTNGAVAPSESESAGATVVTEPADEPSTEPSSDPGAETAETTSGDTVATDEPAADAASSGQPAGRAASDEPERAAGRAADDGATDSQVAGESTSARETIRGHVAAVIGDDSGLVRLLDADCGVIDEGPAEEAFDRVKDADPVPATVVLDGELEQRVLDVAAQRGVEQVVAASTGDYVKRPTSVRVRTADQLLTP